LVAGEASIDDVRQPSFQCSTGLFWSLGLGKFLQVVVPAGTGVADLIDRDPVNSGVELTIASPTESVPRLFAAGGIDGRGAVEAGEVVGIGEPGNIPSVADDLAATTAATPEISRRALPATIETTWSASTRAG
jgi:hypothetical protein